MKLPETACIAIKGPNALPFADDGFHWCEDVIFDNSMSTLDPDGGFQGTTHLIATEIVQKGLVDACGYQPRDIMLFGMGQGGMLALNIAGKHALSPLLNGHPNMLRHTAANKTQEYSGVVSVGGPLPNEAPASLHPKSKTPVLVAYGADSKWVNSSSEDKIKRVFEHVQLSKYRRPGDTMPKDRDEMLPIMQFFARRLKSTAGVPKGAIPLS